MHLQSTYTLHLQYLQSEAHLESSLTSAVELFCGNSQRVKTVGYFRRRAPSWMLDKMFERIRILNVTLPSSKKVCREAFHQWSCTRESWPPPASQFSWYTPTTRTIHHVWLIVSQFRIKAAWWGAPLAFPDFNQNNKRGCSWLVAVKIELIVSRKAGCWTIVFTRLLKLTFPSAAMFINIYNVLMLFELFSREEVATAQLPCTSEKYITLLLYK